MKRRRFFGEQARWGYRFRIARGEFYLMLDLGPFYLDVISTSHQRFRVRAGR